MGLNRAVALALSAVLWSAPPAAGVAIARRSGGGLRSGVAARAEAVSATNVTGDSSKPDPTTGAWQAEDLKSRPEGGLNKCMAKQIATYAAGRGLASVSDYGAGSGAYAMYLLREGHFKTLTCYDGNEGIRQTSQGLCKVVDLSMPQTLPQTDLVYSLEVGEHIPKSREDNFFGNVARGGVKSVIMSWAVPGQKGLGHVNCQTNDHVIGQMQKRGFAYDAQSTADMRKVLAAESCAHEINSGLFTNTLMVFSRAT